MREILEAAHIRKQFGDLLAVDEVSLQVAQGEIFGLLGPNGAGKTTTISMLVGLMPPDAGRILIDGQLIQGNEKDIYKKIGICPQSITLWGRLTCLEQLVFMGSMYGVSKSLGRQRGMALLQDLGLVEKKDKLAKTLSGGMQRRLNLAMGLVHNPEILVLDEPEAGLDPQSRVLVREYIRSLAGEKTVILTTHNMDEADRMADRVAIMDHGKILLTDTPNNLKRSVGAGDVVEIQMSDANFDHLQAVHAFEPYAAEISPEYVAGILYLRGLNIVQHLPDLIALLRANQIEPNGVQLRSNTLEDVFIQLTGRRLRE